MPNDNGFLVLDADDKMRLVTTCPQAGRFIRPLISAKEYLNGAERWCIWLKDSCPSSFRGVPEIEERIASVKSYRLQSHRSSTRALAQTPYLFGEIRQPTTSFVLFPRHSSERRAYVPLSYFGPENIVHDSCLFLPNATPYHFGVLTSAMHMAWVRCVCGRLKSDYRYSAKLVYNNFPWPQSPTAAQMAKVEERAANVLAVRQRYIAQGQTLADLYDPLYIPATLLKAHQALDLAVDRCYRSAPFGTDRERVEFLFSLYEALTAPLVSDAGPKKKRGGGRRGSS